MSFFSAYFLVHSSVAAYCSRSLSLNLGETESGSGKCVGALAGQDLGLGSNVWLLGDSFLKNVYSAFSFDDDAVGFAALS